MSRPDRGADFWTSKKMPQSLAAMKLGRIRCITAASPPAQSAIDNASSALQDFEQMDRRARDYLRDGQKLLASDLIFADGLEIAGRHDRID